MSCIVPEKVKDAWYFRSLWFKILTVYSFFYLIESIFVLTKLTKGDPKVDWRVAIIIFCSIEGLAITFVIIGFVLLSIWFVNLFKLYPQFEPMKAGMITFCTIVIFIQVLRLLTYIIYQETFRYPDSPKAKDFLIFFIVFNVAVELTLNGFVLFYSQKTNSSDLDHSDSEASRTRTSSHAPTEGTIEDSENEAEFVGIDYNRNDQGEIRPA